MAKRKVKIISPCFKKGKVGEIIEVDETEISNLICKGSVTLADTPKAEKPKKKSIVKGNNDAENTE